MTIHRKLFKGPFPTIGNEENTPRVEVCQPRVKLTISLVLALGLGVLSTTQASAQQTLTYTLELSYDALGRIESITHPATTPNMSQTFTYNALDGHKTVSYGGQTIVSATSYTAAGGEDVVTFTPYNFLGRAQLGTITADRDWDDLNRLRSLTIAHAGANIHRARSMNYNEWGYLESVTRDDPSFNGSISYGYTPLGQLKTVNLGGNTVTYGYDNNGNVTSRSRIQQQGLDLPEWGPTAYDSNTNRYASWDYDADGKVTKDRSVNLAYRYNDLERIKAIDFTDPATDEPVIGVAHYLYDGNGERVREVRDDRVIYSVRGPDGQLISQVIHHSKTDGGWLQERRDFVYHNGQSVAVVSHMEVPTGGISTRRQYTLRDRMGSPSVIFDDRRIDRPNNSFTTGHFEYEAYGNVAKAPPHYVVGTQPVDFDHQTASMPWSPVVLQFTGHEYDQTGLYNMHQRYYQTGFSRFVRPDPAFDFDEANPASFNLYAYAHGNPANFVDLEGLQAAKPTNTGTESKLAAAWKDFLLTNRVTAGKAAKTAGGLILAGKVAQEFGAVPVGKWALSRFGALPYEFTKAGAIQVFNLSFGQRAARIAVAAGVNFALATSAYEAGVFAGSVANQYLSEETQDAIGGTINEIVNEGGWKIWFE